MATIYFTTNADSGTGSLRAAISSAVSGDTIMPDPTIFTTGPVEILVSSTLITPQKDITIDGGDIGIILNGQQTNIACISLSFANTYTIKNVTVKRFSRNTNGPIYLNHANGVINLIRCKVVDNQNRYYGAIYVNNGNVYIYDSLICGNNAKDDYSSYVGGIRLGTSGYCTLTRTTVVYNTTGNIYGTSRFTRVNSFVGLTPPEIDGVTPEEIGYINPSTETIPYGEWVEGAWENYDFRLKPSSSYLTGATYETGDKDILGHDRTGSWGAFDGSWIVAGASGSGTVSADTTVDWLEVDSTGTLTLNGADRILTVTRGVFVVSGAAITSATRGYVVAPSASDCDAATLTNVVCCISGAGASNLSASTTGFSWSATDSTKTVVLEKQVSGAWTTVAQTSGTSYSETLSAGDTVRLFDGVSFLTATVEIGPVDPGVSPGTMYVVAAGTAVAENPNFNVWVPGALAAPVGKYAVAAGMAVAHNPNFNVWRSRAWEIVKMQTQTVRPLQSVTLLARIEDAFVAGEYLLNDGTNIGSVKYTCRKKTVRGYEVSWLGVAGHVGVSADADAVLDALRTSSAWTVDATGYTFALAPDTTEHPLFPEPGTYQIVVTIAPTDENPVVIYFDFNVSDSVA